jgi:hypothetical protein
MGRLTKQSGSCSTLATTRKRGWWLFIFMDLRAFDRSRKLAIKEA